MSSFPRVLQHSPTLRLPLQKAVRFRAENLPEAVTTVERADRVPVQVLKPDRQAQAIAHGEGVREDG